MVRELADYPVALIPNLVPPVAPLPRCAGWVESCEGTPVQVGPLVPAALGVGTRKKRMASQPDG